MAENSSKSEKSKDRGERLAAQLRGNLQKRKAQMRARRHAAEAERSDLPTDLSQDCKIGSNKPET